MSNNSLKMTAICLALTGAAALPLQASAQQLGAGEIVTVDAVTGQLRAPTTDERANLERIKSEKSRMFRVAPKQMLPRIHVSGGRGARLTDEMMSASVAVIDKDGNVAQECFDSAADAHAAQSSKTLTHTHATPTPVLE